MFISSGPIGTAVLLFVLLNACSGALDPDREMCYSRQHRDVTVNAHVALDQKGTVMVARAKPSEKDCILTCCSEDVSPGVKCNLVVYKPPERATDLNCQLFHCPSERDCPLMTASTGINTYNIFKGLTHPTTKVSERITAKPAVPQLTTTTTTPTTTPVTTTTTTTTTTTPAPTTTTTTISPTTITITSTSSSISTKATEEVLTNSDPPVMLETIAMTTASATTATSTTQSSTTTKVTITKAPHPPQRMPIRPARPKKPSRPSRPEMHSAKPIRATMEPATTTTIIASTTSRSSTTSTTSTSSRSSTTSTASTTSTTLTTSTASTTTTIKTTTPAAERSTAALIELESDPKHHGFSHDRPLLSLPEKPKVSRVMWKNSLVAIVVITLIFLALILSLVARKAMESFDRRHYTRLELNDLHYEV